MKSLTKKGSLVVMFCLVFFGFTFSGLAQDDLDSNDAERFEYTNGVKDPIINGVKDPMITYIKGSVSSAGTLYNGYNVESVEWNNTYDRWEITLIGSFPYYYLDFTPVVTPYGCSDLTATTSSVGGKMLVCIYDSGVPVKKGFSFFVIY